MPSGNPLGYFPPEVQAELLGRAGPLPTSGHEMAGMIGTGLGEMLVSMLNGAAPTPSFNPTASAIQGETTRRGITRPQQSRAPDSFMQPVVAATARPRRKKVPVKVKNQQGQEIIRWVEQ